MSDETTVAAVDDDERDRERAGDKAPRRGRPKGSRTGSGSRRATGGTQAARKERRAQAAAESIEQLAGLFDSLRGRDTLADDGLDLPAIAKRDAGLMGETLADVAERFTPAAFIVDHVFGAGGPLAIVRAFGPFIRRLFQLARDTRSQRDAVAAEFARRLYSIPVEELRDGEQSEIDGVVFTFRSDGAGGGVWLDPFGNPVVLTDAG